jgi:rhamnogalacturonan endolyase
MKRPVQFAGLSLILGLLATAALTSCSSLARTSGGAAPVTVQENDAAFTLSNGIVTARVLKRNGDLISLAYRGTETLTDQSGRAGGYWSHDASGGMRTITRVTIDPKANGGERAEVSVKGISGGKRMGHPAGVGADAEGDVPVDIEIRYSMGRGESGVYSYCAFDHKAEYPAGAFGEARYCAKLASMFDWLSIDEKRNKYYPRELPGEDKYVYTAVQSENLAYGWSSTTQKIGWWIVNPTIEYLSGGPTKVEFLCHRDTTQVQAPCVLNYWRSSHYGGAVASVAKGEHWTKVVGPFFIYVNSGGDALALWKDARAQAKKESKKWPYDWVAGVDYARRAERATVSGRLVLNDPLAPGGAKFGGKIMVGLTAPAYSVTMPSRGMGSAPDGVVTRQVTWQTDAKHCQFWARSDDPAGKFAVPNVAPGEYTLYAFADGVLGEFTKANVKVKAGKPLNLGKIKWTPVRRGRQLWEIGIANRTATEFNNGDRYFEPDAPLQYALFFPKDVTFVIGKSNPAKDWYFEQVPHNVDPNARVAPFFGIQGEPGDATPYAITFDLPSAPHGKATLRLAICGTGTRELEVTVNDKSAGQVVLPMGDGVIVRHGIQGIWHEHELAFDAALMKQGANVLKIVVPAGPVNDGVIYDYLRLELDENAPAPVTR